MIKKLTRKFILISMLAVAVVLFIIISAINILNYLSITTDSDSILQAMKANGGSFAAMTSSDQGITNTPTPSALPDKNAADTQASSDPQNPGDAEAQAPADPQNPGNAEAQVPADPQNPGAADVQGAVSPAHAQGPGGTGGMTAETPYESRYFSVTLDSSGNVIAADMNNIVSVDRTQAENYAQQIVKSGKTKGFLRYFRYLVYQVPDNENSSASEGRISVCFLDCQRSLSNFRAFLSASILVSLIGLLAVFLLVILLSRRVMRPVEESYRKQKRFITDAGHELKTPLTIIDADASVLEMDIGENEWISDIRKQTKRMTDLTADLIYLSRMDEGSARLEMLDFPLSDIVSETAQSFRSRAQLENKSFETDIEPMISFCGDEKSIRELVGILLDNAVKYSDINGKIRVSLKKKSHTILLTVWNTADGIDPETLPHFFDRFYRADSSRNSEDGGYGIGLSVAKAVAAAHKGKISASTLDGKSICISVVFPDR